MISLTNILLVEPPFTLTVVESPATSGGLVGWYDHRETRKSRKRSARKKTECEEIPAKIKAETAARIVAEDEEILLILSALM